VRKRIAPRLDIDAVQERQPFSFTEVQIERLLGALPQITKDSHLFVIELEQCASYYIWLRDQYRHKATQAEQNAALASIKARSGDLARILRGLDLDSEWQLRLLLGFRVEIDSVTAQLEDLCHAAAKAYETGKKRTGPRREIPVHRIVESLASLYEAATRKPFSHNPNQKTKYVGTPQSTAGRFLIAFFEAVDPAVRQTSISTAMTHVVSSRTVRQESPG
jgi:hypothetical protein